MEGDAAQLPAPTPQRRRGMITAPVTRGMMTAPVTRGEQAWQAALGASALVGAPLEERFAAITGAAARLFDVPIALVSLVAADHHWVESCVGLERSEFHAGLSFCSHVPDHATFVVSDTRRDRRFSGNTLVTGKTAVVFCAAWPLHGPTGRRLGTLCLLDRRPRSLSAADWDTLRDLARLAESELAGAELETALAGQRESRARAEAVMSAVPNAIVTFGEDGLLQSANPATGRIFGYAPGELLGRPVAGLLAGDGAAQIAALSGGSDRGSSPHGEVVGARRDGSTFPLEIAITTSTCDSQSLHIAIAQDITMRKAVQRELDGLRRQNQLILNSAGRAIIGLDRDGLITFANPAAAELFATDIHGLVGQHLHARMHHSHEDGTPYPFEDCPSWRTLRDGEHHHVTDEVFWRADGTCFHAEYASSPMLDDDSVVGAVLTLADISERRAVERMKDEFVSVVSHELRTPLTSIRGALGLLGGGVMGTLPGQAAKMVDIAVANTDRLIRLINGILDLERMESGHVALQPRWNSVSDLLQHAVDAVRGVAEGAAVRIEMRPVDATLHVDGDRIVHALTNLLSNAVKFSPRGGVVELSAVVHDDTVLLTVTDEGRGIPDNMLEVVFERFRQVDASDSREKAGTGLGLAIARRIVEEHGGRIWAEATNGTGACFRVALPLSTPPDSAPGDRRPGTS